MKRWPIILLIIAGGLGAAWLLNRAEMHTVIAGEVYASAQLPAAALEAAITEHGIRSLISLRRARPDRGWHQDEQQLAERLGLGYQNIDLDLEFAPRIDQLLALRNALREAPRPLLLLGRRGADRSELGAVMALLLDGATRPEEIRTQWVRADDEEALGGPLLDAYNAWLAGNGTAHTPQAFNAWLDDEYLDLSGNIHFLVDAIRGQTWWRPWGLIEDGFEFEVRRDEGSHLQLSGWAFDTRHESLLAGVEVHLGGVVFEENWYGIHQPWLIDDFGKEAWLDSGWSASHPLQDFADGCHELTLNFTRLDGSRWTSPPAARICIR